MIDFKPVTYGEKCNNGCVYRERCGEGIYAVRLDTKGILRPCLYREDLHLNYVSSLESGTNKETMREAFRRMEW